MKKSEKNIIDKVTENIFNWELVDIVEVTYGYEKLWEWKYLNTTLFKNFAWINDFEDYEKIYDETYQKLQKKLDLLVKYQDQIKKIKNPSNRINILYYSLEYIKNILKITQIWLPFEIEKIWFEIKLTPKQIKDRIYQMEQYEKTIFGGNVRDNKEELEIIYEYLIRTFKAYKSNLTEEEQTKYLEFVDKVEKNKTFDFLKSTNKKQIEFKKLRDLFLLINTKQDQIKQNKKSIFFSDKEKKELNIKLSKEIRKHEEELLDYITTSSYDFLEKDNIRKILENINETNNKLEAEIDKEIISELKQKLQRWIQRLEIQVLVMTKEISREKYVKIFELVFQFYRINVPVIVDERSSIYDGEDWYYIPNSLDYAYMEIENILNLIQHEIEVHYIVSRNNKKVLGNFRWFGNLQREEGLAKIAWELIKWRNIDDFGIPRLFSLLIMGEILDNRDLYNFIKIYYKLINYKFDPFSRFLRLKRNYPLDYKWVQHKDTSYYRWIVKVIDYFKNWWDIKDLYLAKINFDDIDLVKDIIKKEKISIKYPKFVWEILLYSFFHEKLDYEDFLEHLKAKYNFIDFSKYNLKSLSLREKRIIQEILHLLKGN